MSESWQCPYCKHHATVGRNNASNHINDFYNNNKHDKRLRIDVDTVVCPNPSCKEYTIDVELRFYDTVDLIHSWKLRPQSSAKPLPDYIPTAIKEDYEEACLILSLSPKASATLARRCLQGMIRDFWKVKSQNLAKEIESIKDKVELDTWEAIDVVRTVGNIGAHMEKDINQIVEVDENEAGLLIGLIEMLIEEWYVSRYERQQRLEKIKQLGQDKDTQRKMKVEPVTSE